jgi:mRNA interferase RelE/StbE
VTTAFRASFLRDVRKLRDREVRERVERSIRNVEVAPDVERIAQFRWLTGAAGHGRIRVGDWRIGVIVEEETVTFVRCLHRREVYQYFP